MDSLRSLQPMIHPHPVNPAWAEPKTTNDHLLNMTNEIERVQRISQLIVKEAPIRADLPLLPQLIERQRLLCSLIGPSPMVSPLQNTHTVPHTSAFIPTQKYIEHPLASIFTSAPVSLPTVTLPLPIQTQVPVTVHQFAQYTQPAPKMVRPQFMETLSHLVEKRKEEPVRPETPIDILSSYSPPECPSNFTSRKRKISAEEASAAVSAVCPSSSQHLFQLSEKNFTDSFTRQRSGSSSAEMSPNPCPVSNERPTSEMISRLSRYHNNLRDVLAKKGITVNRDAHGMPLDYSSRPIDEIFKKARLQLENARCFKK